MGEWQPIVTAPKDGTPILVWRWNMPVVLALLIPVLIVTLPGFVVAIGGYGAWRALRGYKV